MRYKTFIIIILASVFIFASCKKAPLTVGKTTTQTRELDDFDTLVVNNVINVVLIKSDHNKVEISAGENIIDNITSEVMNGILTLTDESIFNWIRTYDQSIDIKLYFNDLHHITHSSCGTIKTEGYLNTPNDLKTYEIVINDAGGDMDLEFFQCDTLNINYIYGTSIVNLRGSGNDDLDIRKESFGSVHAKGYEAKRVSIRNNGCGDCSVNASEYLYSKILNISNIYYKGEPAEIEETYGKDARGKLLKISE